MKYSPNMKQLPILVLSVVIAGTTVQQCDINGVLKCWSESSVPEIMNRFRTPEFLKTLNAQYATEEYCSAQTKLDLCMQDYRTNCPSDDTLSLDTIISAGNFLCTDGKQGFINHFHCLMTDAFQTSTLTCMNDMMELSKNVSKAKDNGRNLSSEKCRTSKEAITCIEEKTKISCGESAGQFVHHYLEATLQPLLKDVQCNHSHSPNEYPTSQNVHIVGKTCIKYCYKYPQSSATPVLESTKKEMDGWCETNCKLGNCPENLCTCDCQIPTQVLVCEPVLSKFGAKDDAASWCLNTCKAGHCPEDYCKCHILYSLPRPVTNGL
ncbi:uncharacterized protein LOC133201688 [Saccostrea echinata]|uniref:uncharacterized protein LOC133201688 n=1 Tax=Saccostrea echinata TaxID=191078 RepID=UPI002A83026E|nr:uncharacterized protein LOC133201688 [Saccostrea echinata]